MRRLFLPAFFLVSSLSATLHAALLVDFSPDTTGAGILEANYTNEYVYQIIGDRFTLPNGVTLTGAGQYGGTAYGTLGDSVRFLIFSDPTAPAIIDLTATLDAVDSVGTTTQPSVKRNHATITPTFLAAGSYWFSMPADSGITHVQATGTFDDNIVGYGATTPKNPSAIGDAFFQLEGTIVPEPATGAMLAFGTLLLAARRRRSAQA